MIKITRTIRGLGAIAEAHGVSRSHLSRVAHGLRKSKRLEAILLEHGVKCTPYKGSKNGRTSSNRK